ncbi:unnamed protein product [Ascophyllum nodosum]
MMPRVLGAFACGACVTSAFMLPSPLRSLVGKRGSCSPATPPTCPAARGHQRSLWVSRRGRASERMSSTRSTTGEGKARSSRREVIAGVGKAAAGAMALVASSAVTLKPEKAEAFGPVKIALVDPEYGSVACPPKTQVPGEKAGAGLKPVCVKVTVTANNKEKETIEDAAVFGFVYDEENTSVVANNPDGASDAGQFAIIDKVPVGSNRVSFQFVAAIEPQEDFNSKKLKFSSLKAISYPGGQQYGAITECEMNPLAEGCDFD